MSDERRMGMALELAARALGRTAPNPPVGAVIVREGLVIAEGWTQPPGQEHAEVHALRRLRDPASARGATMFVTLEPCCHVGRTPPCTDAILAAGISRVVVGTVDPFPLVAGKGIAQLRQAGVVVDLGCREVDARHLVRGFVRAVTSGLPEVTLKAAVTMDGQIAAADGASKWITGPAARDAAHRLRDTHDAVVVGAGTVRADDPELTTRIPGGRDAVRVLLDTSLAVDARARMLGRGALVFCAEDAPAREVPAEVVRVARGPGGLAVEAVLRDLAARGLHRVLVEGGGRLHRAFLDAGMVDRVELFVAGRALGAGRGLFAGPGLGLAAAPTFRVVSATTVGDDAHVVFER